MGQNERGMKVLLPWDKTQNLLQTGTKIEK